MRCVAWPSPSIISIVSQAIRIFPRGAHARGKGDEKREGKIRLVSAGFLFPRGM